MERLISVANGEGRSIRCKLPGQTDDGIHRDTGLFGDDIRFKLREDKFFKSQMLLSIFIQSNFRIRKYDSR